MQKLLIGLLVLICLSSCVDSKDKEYEQVLQIGNAINQGLEESSIYNIQLLFSPTRFAMRLGESFYDLPRQERQFAYPIIRDLFESHVNALMDEIEASNYKVNLFDVHEQDEVYRLNYEITDQSEENTYNYLVFYVEKDNDDRFRIVNYYNLLSGFSLGQMAKEQLKDVAMAGRTSYQMKALKARRNIETAVEIASTGDFKFAYETLNRTSKEYLRRGNTAYAKVIFASRISDSLYVEALEWMKKVSPNEQSKVLYDCLQRKVENPASLDDSCTLKIMESLQTS